LAIKGIGLNNRIISGFVRIVVFCFLFIFVSACTKEIPATPQAITITTADNTDLQGVYYPATAKDAPLVVLIHSSGSDLRDWYEIAPWLQNRGLSNPYLDVDINSSYSWWDKSWFPKLPADRSYSVLIFTYRSCANKHCVGIVKETWLLDIQAAMLKAFDLQGKNGSGITTVGSSAGADGAVIGCAYLNEKHPDACKGALSLSGGSFREAYIEAVQKLGENQPVVPVWCIADKLDFGTCESAKAAGNPAFESFLIPGGGHGNHLLSPGLDPLPMQLILDFLDEVVK
jgi:hypothetical protein